MKSKAVTAAVALALILGFFTQASLSVSANRNRLVRDLLQQHNPDLIPALDDEPVNVTLTLFLIDILEVDIERNQVEFLFYVSKEYQDQSLAWDPSEYDLDVLHLRRKDVWRPDVLFQDDIGSVSHQPEQSDLVDLKSDGTVTMADKRRVRTLCQVYALSDRHAAICEIRLAPSSLDTSLLFLTEPTETTPNAMLFSDASKYQLIEMRARKDILHYLIGSYEEMVFTITFGRITPLEDK